MATSHYSAEESPKDARMPGMEVVFFHPPLLSFSTVAAFSSAALAGDSAAKGEGKGLREYMRKKELGSEEFRGGFFCENNVDIFC